MTDQLTAAVLFTGGKDSTFAIEALRTSGFKIVCLITIISENAYSYMLHTPNIKIAELSAEALQIPISFGSTKGEKEKELEDIRDTVSRTRKDYDFQFLASGGLSSNYQKKRLENIAGEIGLEPVNPMWGIDQQSYMKQLVRREYKFILTSVSSAGLDEKWLGRNIDANSLKELLYLSEKYHFNPAFEGGEAETLVIDCPLFQKQSIEIREQKKIWEGDRGKLVIKEARLVPKPNILRG